MPQAPVRGPASYFPSIEKTYGYPVSHWFAVLDKAAGLKHGEQVALLRGEAAVDVPLDHLALLLVGLSRSPWGLAHLVT